MLLNDDEVLEKETIAKEQITNSINNYIAFLLVLNILFFADFIVATNKDFDDSSCQNTIASITNYNSFLIIAICLLSVSQLIRLIAKIINSDVLRLINLINNFIITLIVKSATIYFMINFFETLALPEITCDLLRNKILIWILINLFLFAFYILSIVYMIFGKIFEFYIESNK